MNTVTLVLPESTVVALLAVLGHGMTSEVCVDLGLDTLYQALSDELGRTDVDGLARTSVLVRREHSVPVTVTLRDYPRRTHIDLT